MFVCCVAAQQLQRPARAIPEDRRKDTFDVYSAALARPSLSHPDNNRKYAILDTTGATYPMADPASCLHVPNEYRSRFEQILTDYAKYANDRFRLTPNFSIVKPYELVDEEAAKKFREERRHGRGAAPFSPFDGVVDLITLGNVFFDSNRTLAVVQISAWCGGLCGFQTWRVFEKRAGAWQEKQWHACIAIS